jgi:hypothetical protein
MRLDIASMALSLAIFSRHARTASAFTMRPLTTSSSVTSSVSSQLTSSASKRARRRRPVPSSETLKILWEEHIMMSQRGSPLRVGAVEGSETAVNGSASDQEDILKFPLKGRNVEEAPPRMRFAPSPTGR